eukprot:gnl/Spiro4/28698_TR14197_c0_g3_i1.p2 gnl/Spiro4/28698_TR14197_c0_g3~~gnl/Spiro4/28698_TR14197_c0_g3_i1.p2  ORF type:complete len:215 (-),score=14.45 gnl/Spiro4/28698_TR14197_c0_g3_i1:4785-5429(-)
MANQQQQYRRRQSRPATLLTRLPSVRRMEEVQNNQEEVEQEEELDGGYSGPSEPTEEEVEAGNQNEWGTDHVTRTGAPDRRFKEHRALTEEDVGGGNYRRATVGRVVDGIHVTEDGAPDRRFKENRALTDEDIEIRKAELILAKHGILKPEISPTAILASHAPSNAPTQTRLVAQQPRQESPLARVARASSTRTKAAQHKGPAKATANGSRGRR